VNLGPGEILLLAIFALIFFGPKRLPEIARQIGKAVAEIRKYTREFETEVNKVTEPFTREYHEALDPGMKEAHRLEDAARSSIPMDAEHSRFLGPPRPPVEQAPAAEDDPPKTD
jgi:Tat protein translocase TatB subunit